ncbi:MAG TPA: hypothetical protein VIV36_00395 [Gaiella sp.]
MRALLALVVVTVLAVGASTYIAMDDDDVQPAATGSVTLVGDSLNVGIDPYLREELDGWTIDAHDRVGRSTDEGVAVLRELRSSLAPVVVLSLGTNDPDGSESRFEALVSEAVEVVGPSRCLLWATIVRDGIGRIEFNRALVRARAANPNVRLVEWALLVSEDDSLLESDFVHGTPEGYAARAAETARAVRACRRA